MTDTITPNEAHAAAIVAGVLGNMLQDTGAAGVLLLESDSPEGRLVLTWLSSALGEDRVFDATAAGEWPAPAGLAAEPGIRTEAERAAARVFARPRNLILAHPANKTVLLLSRWVPPEPVLPMGDVYASAVRELSGGCTLPDDLAAMADRAGGLEALDRALYQWLEMRRPLVEALGSVPVDVRADVMARLKTNRTGRRWPRCVPKIGMRTLWIDVFA